MRSARLLHGSLADGMGGGALLAGLAIAGLAAEASRGLRARGLRAPMATVAEAGLVVLYATLGGVTVR